MSFVLGEMIEFRLISDDAVLYVLMGPFLTR